MSAMPRRPVLRYHGGKWRIAPWIISHFPAHRVYVEPFGGAASVLMRKPKSFAEVYNDLDGDLVNVFRVLRDPISAALLRALLELTPWARAEFDLSYVPCPTEPIEQARRTMVRCAMGHGTSSRRKGRTGFRGKAFRQNQTGSQDWTTWPQQIDAWVERLRAVVIECRPAYEIIAHQDTPETLFYVDPPYPLETRNSMRNRGDLGRAYAHEMTTEDHTALADQLREVRGMVVLSGYACPLYDDDLYHDWFRVDREAWADGGRKRTEVLWLNRACFDALESAA